MKKTLLLVSLTTAVYISSFQNLSSNSGGIAGFAGSPADNGQNCTSCHTGTPQTVSNVITTDIPADGYMLGETYTITLSVSHPTFNRFGFSFSAQNPSNGNQIGNLSLTNTNATRLNQQGKYVGHTSAGTQGTNNARVWSFEWTAPATNEGPVGLYGAFNLTNGNNATSGDVTQLQNIIVQPNPSINTVEFVKNPFKVYPNPTAQSFLHVEFPSGQGSVKLVNLAGVVVLDIPNQMNGRINLPLNLAKGIYLIEMRDGAAKSTQKIWIK